jgi:hypothetical protein
MIAAYDKAGVPILSLCRARAASIKRSTFYKYRNLIEKIRQDASNIVSMALAYFERSAAAIDSPASPQGVTGHEPTSRDLAPAISTGDI